jgi:hypothetical protein
MPCLARPFVRMYMSKPTSLYYNNKALCSFKEEKKGEASQPNLLTRAVIGSSACTALPIYGSRLSLSSLHT